MSSSVLIVIPARGGSKRFPNKNVKPLAGRTLMERVSHVVASFKNPQIQHLVSTDDPVIADLAMRCGLNVPFIRPSELATDNSSTVDATIHALDWWRQSGRAEPDIVVLLQITSPFRDIAKISAALTMLDRDKRWDAVISVKELQRTPRTVFVFGPDVELIPLDAGNDHCSLLTPDGNFYLIRTEVLRMQKTFFPTLMTGIVMDSIASIDIDTAADWQLAEAMAVAQANQNGPI